MDTIVMLSRLERTLHWLLIALVAMWIGLNGAVWWPQMADESPVYLEPQGNVRAVLADAWRTDGKPVFELDNGEGVDDNRAVVPFLPRDASLVDGEMVPKDFAYAVAAAAAVSAGGAAATVILSLLASLAAAVMVGLLVWELTKQLLPSLVGTALAVTSVVWWAGSYGGVSLSFAGVAFGLSACWVLLRNRGRSEPLFGFDGGRFLVAGALVGIAVGFHYATFPWWSSILLASVIGLHPRPDLVGRRFAWTALGGLAGLFPVLVFNAWIYGSPFSTGYDEFATVLEAVGWEAGSIGFSPQAVLDNLGVYLTRPELLPLMIAGAYSHRLVDSAHLEIRRYQAMIVGIGLVIFVGVSASSPLWGTGVFLTNASILRYLAPVMALVLVATAVGFDALWESGSRASQVGAVALVAFILGVNMTTVLWQPNGVADTRRLLDEVAEQQESVLSVVPGDALVVTRRLDKIFFPHRTTVTASYLVTSTPAGSEVVHLYDTLPDDDELLAFLDDVEQRKVFIMNDTGWVSQSSQARLGQALAESGQCLLETEVTDLFEIGLCRPSVTE